MPEKYLKQCITKAVSEEGKSAKLWFGVSSVQGWRSIQEDAHLALPEFEANASLFGVFDGHNGAEVAKFVAQKLPQIILKNNNYREGNIELGLQESLMTLDESLLTRESVVELIRLRQEYSKEPLTCRNAPAIVSGCTAVVVLIKDNVLYVANLGDSRCILSRNNKAFPLSSDHKPGDQTEKQRIERAGGQVVCGRIKKHNKKINISRAFGDHLYKRNSSLPQKEQMIIAWPDVVVEQLKPNKDEFMVLMSDGVSNCMSNEELISFLAKGIKKTDKLSKICEQLFARLLPQVMPKKGAAGRDNMTLMIVKFERTNQNPFTSQAVKEKSPQNQNQKSN
jgi:serine/threonine protein phosphatase PrpC